MTAEQEVSYGPQFRGVRVRRRRKRASHVRVAPAAPTRPNERWCMDFMADRLEDGRRIRILTVEDVLTRECLAADADVGFSSARVVAVVEGIAGEPGYPATITVDNGSEFYSRTRPTAGPTGMGCGWTSLAGQTHGQSVHREVQRAAAGRAPQHR